VTDPQRRHPEQDEAKEILVLASSIRAVVALGLLVCAPFKAGAVDGALPINQTAAVQGYLTATDTPGFPVTLDSPGHYVLTSNLELPDANTHGVLLTASNITLDLNGFSIACSACAGAGGSGHGITSDPGVTDATVRNGTVRDLGGSGVSLSGQRTRVEGVRAFGNRGQGIRGGQNARVERSIVFLNFAGGISVSAHSVVKECLAASNAGEGIETTMGGVVERNVSSDNAGDGFQTDLGSVLTANVSSFNGGFGINAYNSSVTHNATVQNVNAGIFAEDSSVMANVSTSNAAALQAPSATTGYGNNLFSGNGFGAQVSGGLQLDANVCGGDLVCP
jgi:hypothetical protein